jgi:hypothetical protein
VELSEPRGAGRQDKQDKGKTSKTSKQDKKVERF